MKPGAAESADHDHVRPPRWDVVVIGYGNTLRGDDAAGPRAASVVAGWGLSGVSAQAVPQLTPELAESLASARLAIFVDARLADEGGRVAVRPIEPADQGTIFGHAADPRRLLALTRTAYGSCPRSWLITVPAADFRLGEGLSPMAESGVEGALRQIARLAHGALSRCSGPD
jgi:hydrogenase maturation protease